MKSVFLLILLGLPLKALPNAVLGALAQHDSPLNGDDLTDVLLASGVWDGSQKLPGEWEADAGVANARAAYLMARPKVFGVDALLVRATHRDENLEELQITFADAGSYFGYLDQSLPKGMEKEAAMAEMQRRLEERRQGFVKLYEETEKALTTKLAGIDEKPKQSKRGRTRDLRAELSEFEDEESGLVIQLLAAPDRLLRVSIRKKGTEVTSWLDASQEKLATGERLKELAAKVAKTDRGDVVLEGVQVVPQGYRPYCGLNTLTMVARYLGLHLDEDWLAVAGKFQNTGSAAGSDMLGLYNSVAKEAKFNLNRRSSYDHETVRRSIRNGMPVIVWRRWDQGRDQLHSRISREFDGGGETEYERADEEALPSKKKRSPLHASVIIGYNDERKEVIFLESWEGKSSPRRMPVSEIAHTADFTFAFQP
jgi:hypothetical protein